jgi:hypothetical protein
MARKSSSLSGSITPIRRGTGPRTAQGKQRSKRNSTKHGLFSNVVVLDGESPAEYRSLWAGLRQSWLPEGKMEELLVEELAMFFWRLRRCVDAERAEIRMNTQWAKVERVNQMRAEVRQISQESAVKTSLILHIHNREILQRCIVMLQVLRAGIQVKFDRDRDMAILCRIYGDHAHPHLIRTLDEIYELLQATAVVSEEERQRGGYQTPDQCKQNMVKAIDHEIERLELHQQVSVFMEADRTELEIARQSVPTAPELDRFLRYQASPQRGIDRTIVQLERLQRIRKGQPVAPRIDVNVSAD